MGELALSFFWTCVLNYSVVELGSCWTINPSSFLPYCTEMQTGSAFVSQHMKNEFGRQCRKVLVITIPCPQWGDGSGALSLTHGSAEEGMGSKPLTVTAVLWVVQTGGQLWHCLNLWKKCPLLRKVLLILQCSMSINSMCPVIRALYPLMVLHLP